MRISKGNIAKERGVTANPAITMVRSLSDSFDCIAPHDVPLFIAAQALGATAGAFVGRFLFD